MKSEIQEREFFLKAGYLIIAIRPTVIYSVIGSAVVVCLYDRNIKIGGCSNYLYPTAPDKKDTRVIYGNVAIPVLVKMMQEEGATLQTMEAQIFGGADREGYDIGKKNVDIALHILQKKGITISSQDTGGNKGRKLIYHTATNIPIVAKVDRIRSSDWYPYQEREV